MTISSKDCDWFELRTYLPLSVCKSQSAIIFTFCDTCTKIKTNRQHEEGTESVDGDEQGAEEEADDEVNDD